MQLYTTNAGRKLYRPSETELAAMIGGDSGGYCIACGEAAPSVEPDASGHKCEACGLRKVHGAEALLHRGFYHADGAVPVSNVVTMDWCATCRTKNACSQMGCSNARPVVTEVVAVAPSDEVRVQCTCKECRRAKLNPEEPTELDLHRMRRARATGKSKNPSWYTAPSMPPSFKPQLGQRYPGYVLAMFSRLNVDTWPEFVADAKELKSTAKYIAAYEQKAGLKHVKLRRAA